MKFTIPKVTDRLLVAEYPACATTVVFNPWGACWHGMASSYWTAGSSLIQTIQKEGYASGWLLPPAIFLFRHAVELSLKGILKDVISFQSEVPSKIEKNTLDGHKLDGLWRAVNARFLRISGHSNNEWWKRAGEIIQQLQNLDPDSLEFRYPESKNGLKPTSAGQGIRIDVAQFKDVLDELLIILDGTPAWLDANNGLPD